MKLPNLSYMMTVGQVRSIQARWETGERRNPDTLVTRLLPLRTRVECALRGAFFRRRMRRDPFYDYVAARTKYYDALYLAQARRPVRAILNIGCGSDTRAYRFAPELLAKSVEVVECDQADAIRAKERAVRKRWQAQHVSFMPIDLNAEAWPELERWLQKRRDSAVLVMLEGVSPYVSAVRFEAFLAMLADQLGPESVVAYDFKIAGVSDEFGRGVEGHVFRLPGDKEAVTAFHARLGLRAQHVETSAELCARLVPGTGSSFHEDGLVVLSPTAG